MTATPDQDTPGQLDDLIAHCVLVYERDGDRGVDVLLAGAPALADAARARFVELREAGLLLEPARHPERIGPYRVLQHLGSGGMGAVYLAEQQQPVARRVAIKVIRPGMDSREVLARFTVERQALALLDHPHVARIFDAGITDDGRPFLVMEHVDGVPLLRYCDGRKLSIAARLQLFLRVCDAVQHAHHKGVIHRDLKPSNVLVAERDGAAWPVVIDFGVAKSVRGRLTDRSTMTLPGQMLGTPEYMSPEQAHNELDVDTRTDVYSLGVVLYELLTGTLPVAGTRRHRADPAHLARLLNETDPPTPSSRMTDLGGGAVGIADCRATSLGTLQKRLRGDLDWIVLRALARDRDRRYGMPAELAADLQRHLDCEPVLAGPPTTRYRFAKFLRRNRLQVGASAAVVAALVVGLATSLLFWRDAMASEQIAVGHARRAEHNLEHALLATKELMSFGNDALLGLPHMEPVRRQLLEASLVQFRALEAMDTSGDPRTLWHLADAQRLVGALQLQLGNTDAALANLSAAHARFAGLPTDTVATANYEAGLGTAEHNLAAGLLAAGRAAEATPLLVAATNRLRTVWQGGAGTDSLRHEFLTALLDLARLSRRQDRDLARRLYAESDAILLPWLQQPADAPSAELPLALTALCEHAGMLIETGDPANAKARVTSIKATLDAVAPTTAAPLLQRRFLTPIRRLADLLDGLEDRQPAVDLLGRSITTLESLAQEHPDVVAYRSMLVTDRTLLAISLIRLGRNADAEQAFGAAVSAADALVSLDASPNHHFALAYALIHGGYGMVFYAGFGGEADLGRARTALERGLAVLMSLPVELLQSNHGQRMLAMGTRTRGTLRARGGEVAEAIADLAAASEIYATSERDADDVETAELALDTRVEHAGLLLQVGRAKEALPVLEAAHQDIARFKARMAQPDDWLVKDRNIRSALARARGLTGDVSGAVQLFATLGQDDDDWIGRDFAGKGLLETCCALPPGDARRADLLQQARSVLQSSLQRERAQERSNRMVLVMRSGTNLILAEVEQEAGDLRAAAAAWAEVAEGYEASFRGRASDRNRTRLAMAMQRQASTLLQLADPAAARTVANRMAEQFASHAAELVTTASIAARCATAAGSTPDAERHAEAGADWLLAALAAGYRDVAALRAQPELAPLLAITRVAQAIAGLER